MKQVTLFENKPIEDIRPFRWITLLEQKEFVNFLKNLGGVGNELLHDGKLEWCASEFEKFNCSNHFDHRKKVDTWLVVFVEFALEILWFMQVKEQTYNISG